MTPFEWGAIVVQALGWSLVHFVWQAALIGVVYAAARVLLPRGNPRYLAAMLALVALAVTPVWTAWHEVAVLTQTVDVGNMLVTAAAASPAHGYAPTVWLARLGVALPWLVLVWTVGVAFLGIRVVRQWFGLRAIVRAAEALPVWQDRANALGERLGLRRAVRVLASVRIATPTLVGWARPVVVMPLAMLARMPAEQVDLILAHELAHVRRFDHLANLFQVVVETLFFYHPVVHWISRDARNERELCCDTLALQGSGGSRRDFVAAFAGLGEISARAARPGPCARGAGRGLVRVVGFCDRFDAGVAPERGTRTHRRRACGQRTSRLAAIACGNHRAAASACVANDSRNAAGARPAGVCA